MKTDASPSNRCDTCSKYIAETSRCKLLPSYKNHVSPDFNCERYEPLGLEVHKSPFTYDAVHNDFVCKACGRVFETDEEWCALAVDGKFEWKEMRYCPMCGYPADMEIAELRGGAVFTVESVGDWAFSCMEGCDEPEFSMYSTINDAVERYKQGKYGKPSPERRYAHGSVECIDAIKAALSPEEWRGFVKGNVLKYVWREAYKGGDCDLEKARDYLGRYLEKGAADEPMEKA